jgi:hypothetical protein
MKSGKEADRYHTLTGGVEAALTTKELFLEDTNGDWVGLAPSTFLAVSTEEVRDDDTSACAAISPPFLVLLLLLSVFLCVRAPTTTQV